MNLEINTTITFEHLLDSTKRVSQHIGGTRSGKSYGILQFLIVRGLESTQTITVVRRTIPSLKRTIIKDFTDILKGLGVWRDDDWNITDRTYKLGNMTPQEKADELFWKYRPIIAGKQFLTGLVQAQNSLKNLDDTVQQSGRAMTGFMDKIKGVGGALGIAFGATAVLNFLSISNSLPHSLQRN